MSTLAKARSYSRGFPWFVFDAFTQYQEQGPDYIAAILKGYVDPPKDFKLPSGGNYNEYFPGHVIAMPQPLQAGQVTFDDGAPQTMEEYSKDVRAAHGRAQAYRLPGDDLPDRVRRADVFRQEKGLVGGTLSCRHKIVSMQRAPNGALSFC